RRFKNIARALFRPVGDVQVNVHKVIDTAIQKGLIKNLVQVGSNDGKKNDPVRPFIEKYPQLKGVLVEPMKNNFDKLLKNYVEISHRLSFLNAGISDKKGTLTFYYIKDITENE
ncbi:MAG TPA: hypothetical protein PLR98_13095, partial [Chitinophagaceae bacterium]|nr:hypothetical protein [Chitinophagaceae bacterium]